MKMKNVSFFAILFLFLVSSIVYSAEKHSDYKSMHDGNVSIVYTDLAGELKSETRVGYKNVNNLNDPKVLCHEESCISDEEVISLPTIKIPQKLQKLRVFLPPGTVYMLFTLYTRPDPLIGSVSRFNALPDCAHCNAVNFSATPFQREGSYLFNSFDNDLYLQNAGGHIQIYSKFLYPANPDGTFQYLQEGGWFYVNNYHNVNDIVPGGDCSIRVNKAVYLDWYNNYDWSSDPNGLSAGGTVIIPDETLSVQWINSADANLDIDEDATFKVTGASGNYGFAFNNPLQKVCGVVQNSDEFTVTALSPGSTVVTVSDLEDATVKKDITISVQQSQDTTELELPESVPGKIELTMANIQPYQVNVTGGTLPNMLLVMPVNMEGDELVDSQLIVSDGEAGGFVQVSAGDDGRSFNIVPVSVGQGYLAVVDSKLNFTRVIAIEVRDALIVIEKASAAEQLIDPNGQGIFLDPDSENNELDSKKNNILFKVKGGTPPYKIKYTCLYMEDENSECNPSLEIAKRIENDFESPVEVLGDDVDTFFEFSQNDEVNIKATAPGKFQIYLKDSSGEVSFNFPPLYSSTIIDAEEEGPHKISLDDTFSLKIRNNPADVTGIKKEFLIFSTDEEALNGSLYLFDGEKFTAFTLESLFGDEFDWETVAESAYGYKYDSEYVLKAVTLADELFEPLLPIEAESSIYFAHGYASDESAIHLPGKLLKVDVLEAAL